MVFWWQESYMKMGIVVTLSLEKAVQVINKEDMYSMTSQKCLDEVLYLSAFNTS